MTKPTQHSPAEIILLYLVAAGHAQVPAADGVLPELVGNEWSASVHEMPNTPPEQLTLYDTEPTKDSRSMRSGDVHEHHGVQLLVRSATHVDGDRKSRNLCPVLDALAPGTTISIDGSNYTIHNASRTGGVLPLGSKDGESTRRFSINLLVSISDVT